MEQVCDAVREAPSCKATKLGRDVLLGAFATLMLLCLALAALPQQAYAAVAPPATIEEIFPDKALAETVALALNADTSSMVDQDDLDAVVNLATRQGSQVRDLSGLQYLRNLVELEIDGGRFDNSLQDIAALVPKLERLALLDTTVTGNLGQLSGFPNLTGINLSLCGNVTGDLADLASSMPKATVINFSATDGIAGSLSSLASHPNKGSFTALMLGDMETVEGNLASLKDMTSLQTLDVSLSYKIEGDIADLEGLPLAGLGITSTGITGKTSTFSTMGSLTRIEASNTAITGNIAAFMSLDNLEFLFLDGTDVYGEIGSLSGLGKLKYLTIAAGEGASQLEGELGDLQNVKLRLLDLSGQPIGGSLADLAPIAGRMQAEVYLNNTKVAGTLSDLVGDAYNVLGLANTGVSGDVSAFKEIEAKTVWSSINLMGTDVTGDIAAFEGYSFMASLSVSNTGVHGRLSDLPNSPYLVAVNAANTALAGSLDELHKCGNLNFLDLSGCANVQGGVEALADNVYLNQVKLSGTGVSGDVNALADLEHLTLLELYDLAITLDPLSFDGSPIAVDIPVLFKGGALEPTDFTGSTATVNGSQLTWAVPEALSGTLGYSFGQNVEFDSGLVVGYSGTVSQAYESKIVPVPTPKPTPQPTPTPVPAHFSGSSEYVKGSNKDLVFVVEKDFAGYEKGTVDSAAFTSDMASVAEGSTVATIHASYLETLRAGKHTVTLFFKDGASYSGEFTVKAASGGGSGGGVLAKTGDAPLAAACGILGGAAVLAALLVAASRRGMRPRDL